MDAYLNIFSTSLGKMTDIIEMQILVMVCQGSSGKSCICTHPASSHFDQIGTVRLNTHTILTTQSESEGCSLSL